MRIMAIDYGDARTGVAISDPTGLLAGHTAVIRSRKPEFVAEEPDLEGKRYDEGQKICAWLAHFYAGQAQHARQQKNERHIQQSVAAAGQKRRGLMEAEALV